MNKADQFDKISFVKRGLEIDSYYTVLKHSFVGHLGIEFPIKDIAKLMYNSDIVMRKSITREKSCKVCGSRGFKQYSNKGMTYDDVFGFIISTKLDIYFEVLMCEVCGSWVSNMHRFANYSSGEQIMEG